MVCESSRATGERDLRGDSGAVVGRRDGALTASGVQDAWNLKELVGFLDLAGIAPLGDGRVVMAEVERRGLLTAGEPVDAVATAVVMAMTRGGAHGWVVPALRFREFWVKIDVTWNAIEFVRVWNRGVKGPYPILRRQECSTCTRYL